MLVNSLLVTALRFDYFVKKLYNVDLCYEYYSFDVQSKQKCFNNFFVQLFIY